MSCAIGTCNSNNSIYRDRERTVAARSHWLWRIWAKFGSTVMEARRRQAMIEFEKVRQRRISLMHDDRLLRDLGLTREEAMRDMGEPFSR